MEALAVVLFVGTLLALVAAGWYAGREGAENKATAAAATDEVDGRLKAEKAADAERERLYEEGKKRAEGRPTELAVDDWERAAAAVAAVRDKLLRNASGGKTGPGR